MSRVFILAILVEGCTLKFDPALIDNGVCAGVAEGDSCSDNSGTCHDSACCRGCWDGSECADGTEANTCGVAGGSCVSCESPKDQCIAGQCVLERRVVTLSAGLDVTAVVDALGALWTFGVNTSLGSVCHPDGPPARLGGDGDWQSASEACCGVDTTLAIAADGTRWGCGFNGDYEIGDSTMTQRDAIVPADSKSWKVVYAGTRSGMGILEDGTLWGWGLATGGRLGYPGTQGNSSVPVQIGTSMNWVAVTQRNTVGFGIDDTATLWSWGNAEIGRTSSDMIGTIDPPGWAEVAPGGKHVCAIRTDSSLWCWGDNSTSQLGITGMTSATLPQPVDDNFWRHVGSGHAATCGIQRDGTLWCWGDNTYGQLGIGSTTLAPVPTQVGTDTDWEQVSIAWYHACASKLDGELWCWGQVPGLASSMTPALVPLVP